MNPFGLKICIPGRILKTLAHCDDLLCVVISRVEGPVPTLNCSQVLLLCFILQLTLST